jgi:drug/metabolite transporter (DMT)-like permease
MLWFWIVIASQFAQAVALFLDKFLLTKNFPKPAVLTFLTAAANLFGVLFVFWDFNFSASWQIIGLSILSGIAFTVALQFLYMGLKRGEATHITPLVGAVVPVVSFFLSFLWFGEVLTQNQTIAVVLLVFGALLISFETTRKGSGVHIGYLWAILGGIFFALSYVLARAVFIDDTFSTGFVWARLGGFIAALPFLLSKSVRAGLLPKPKTKKQKQTAKTGLIVLVINKGLAAIYFVGMNFAISLTSATLVNALAGLQFALLFILVFASTKLIPKFFNEYFTRTEIIQQIIALLFIIAGLGFMVI